jgi:hypothetical protein
MPIWKKIFTSNLRISSSFFYIFFLFWIFLNLWTVIRHILNSGWPESAEFRWISAKCAEFVNPGYKWGEERRKCGGSESPYFKRAKSDPDTRSNLNPVGRIASIQTINRRVKEVRERALGDWWDEPRWWCGSAPWKRLADGRHARCRRCVETAMVFVTTWFS